MLYIQDFTVETLVSSPVKTGGLAGLDIALIRGCGSGVGVFVGVGRTVELSEEDSEELESEDDDVSVVSREDRVLVSSVDSREERSAADSRDVLTTISSSSATLAR
jgi:hypothetical protein